MPDTTKPYKFDGFGAPQYTSVPDVLFDTLLAELENAELRVLLYIIRRTFGFKKDSDDIAISQMVDGIIKRDGTVLDRGTGLSRPTVKRALRGLVAKGIIVSARNQSANGGNDANTYALRYKNEAKDLRVTGDPTPPCLTDDPTPRVTDDPHKKQSFKTQFFEYSNGCAKTSNGKSYYFRATERSSNSQLTRANVRNNGQAGRSPQGRWRTARPLFPTPTSNT
jgi:Bacteriophage replication protein O